MMKKSGVKKMQVGGMAARRAALDSRMAARRAAQDANRAPSAARTARRQATDVRMAANREAQNQRAAMRKEQTAARRASSSAFKERIAAARARRGGMKSGGSVKKYAEGGSVYRKSADGIATKGKTRGMEVRMAKGGKC